MHIAQKNPKELHTIFEVAKKLDPTAVDDVPRLAPSTNDASSLHIAATK